ncbi:MAG TPA: S9 family peptidase [Candidatus Dormibacteraeota bacterium]|nr:S9 family peptidase [Candidatus Dormibacteraeota bacterium]
MRLGLRDLLDLRLWLAFDIDDSGRILAGHDESGSVQLVELAPGGTATRLTALPGACAGRYLPGSRTVVVEHDQDGNERHQLSLLSLDHLPEAPVGLEGLTPLVRDQRFFHNLIDVSPGRVVYTTNRRNSVDFDVVVRDLATGAEAVLYDQGGATYEVAVAPAGDRAVLGRLTDQPMSQQLLLVDATGGTVRPLTGACERAQHRLPYWLLGAESLVVTTDRDREYTAIARLTLATGEWKELVATEASDVTGWLSPDTRLLLVVTNDDGASRAAIHDAATGRLLRALALTGDGWIGGPGLPDPVWSPDSRFIALSYSAASSPGRILRVDVESGTVTAVMEGAGLPAGTRLAEPTVHRVPTPDGELIPCYVYRSSDPLDPALASSAVLYIHGGPESQSVRGFNPVVQGLAAAGYTVLQPNVRGSTGYGKRWYSADDGPRRLDSVADLAALHAWLPTLGVDPNRVALWGGSYGGYMVLAGVAFQPDLWAVGVDIVGIASLVTFLANTSAYRRAQRESEYGSLEHDRAFLESASPLTRVDAIRAPLFVIHGANDPRVPLAEAEQLTAALRLNQIECELLVYADEGHGLAKRANRLDAYPKAAAFLARYLAPAAGTT